MFRTPSNNIHCMAIIDQGKTQPDDLVCDISKIASRPLRPKPADCEFDWGQRFVLVPRGNADMGCYSDWVGSDFKPDPELRELAANRVDRLHVVGTGTGMPQQRRPRLLPVPRNATHFLRTRFNPPG